MTADMSSDCLAGLHRWIEFTDWVVRRVSSHNAFYFAEANVIVHAVETKPVLIFRLVTANTIEAKVGLGNVAVTEGSEDLLTSSVDAGASRQQAKARSSCYRKRQVYSLARRLARHFQRR